MKIGITKLIPENIAPQNAKNLAVFDGDTKICDVDIGKMKPNLGTPLYRFGLVSDTHLDGNETNATRLNDALTFYESQGCSFCCHSGDLTNVGFYYAKDDTEMYLAPMTEFKSVIDAHPNLPMYGCVGNHESYNKPIIYNLAELKAYTGWDLCYTITHQNDAFIFFGQPGGTSYVEPDRWKEQLNWLQEQLEANRNRRCFVFEHLTLNDDAGNPNNIHNAFWYELESTLIGLLQHYKNTILFHGHSHFDLKEQLNFSYMNYSTRKGFRSVHVPSTVGGRITVDGVKQDATIPENRSGYVAEVYENCIVLKGYNFHEKEYVPIAQYCIDTTLVEIPAGTFTDSTGTIET